MTNLIHAKYDDEGKQQVPIKVDEAANADGGSPGGDFVTQEQLTNALQSKLGNQETGTPRTLALGDIPVGSLIVAGANDLHGEVSSAVLTFAWGAPEFPLANSENEGAMVYATGISSEGAILLRCRNSRWIPASGVAIIHTVVADVIPQAGMTASGTSTEVQFTAANYTLPAGVLSNKGSLVARSVATFASGATAIALRIKANGVNILGSSTTTSINHNSETKWQNRNAANAQFSTANMSYNAGGAAPILTTVDTAAAVPITWHAQLDATSTSATLLLAQLLWVEA